MARWGLDLSEPHRRVPEQRHVQSVRPPKKKKKKKKKPTRWRTLKLSPRERRAA